ncbi:MAG: hypothetical protein JEZ03_02710 [Bacteroidales bacterium]|nr:hypothetical protein [Bacteroidales bacterium]
MKTSVELSYYPLNNDYLTPIKGFIERLNQYDNLIVKTNGMSTQVFGEFRDVMNAITDEIEKSFELPHSVFVMKVINADLEKLIE